MSRPRASSDPSDDRAPMAPLPGSKKDTSGFAQMKAFGQKSECGFVGLSNQGATCYLNSLLQCLYMTPEFRYTLFKWQYNPPPEYADKPEFEYLKEMRKEAANTETKSNIEYDYEPTYCIPYQMQCLFSRLRLSIRGSVGTQDLTKSFHWTDGEAFQQHDVQELLRVLFDAVSKALKHDPDYLNRLCEGKFIDYLDCQVCHFDRFRQDVFLDLSVNIQDMSSLDEALKGFVLPETMDGGNQVFCDNCNQKQNFKKGLKFSTLPPLLFIQLKRFTFDLMTMRRKKLGQKVIFPDTLDMSQYLGDDDQAIKDYCERNNATKDDLMYELYGIIIQSGGALGGHYYAYIKDLFPNKEHRWYCFNDSSVTPLKDNNFEKAFGGEKVKGTGYVLLYRQLSLKMPDDVDYVPSPLKLVIAQEDEEVRKKWEAWQKEMRSINIHVRYRNSKEYGGDGVMKIIKVKVDTEEFTFDTLHKHIRKELEIDDKIIPVTKTRLRRYHSEWQFLSTSYDFDRQNEHDNIKKEDCIAADNKSGDDENTNEKDKETTESKENKDTKDEKDESPNKKQSDKEHKSETQEKKDEEKDKEKDKVKKKEKKKEIYWDDDLIARAKWPKTGLILELETLEKNVKEFPYVNKNDILMRFFVVTDDNLKPVVDRGFIQASRLAEQEMPPGDTGSVIVDDTVPMSTVKANILEAMKNQAILPKSYDPNDALKLNLVRFSYNSVTLLGGTENVKSLRDYRVKLGDLLYIEQAADINIIDTNTNEDAAVTTTTANENNDKNEDAKDKESKDGQENKVIDVATSKAFLCSPLAQYYEEQRLKITVQFNAPLTSETAEERIESLLLDPLQYSKYQSERKAKAKQRLEFNHAIRFSKERPLKDLKLAIGNELGLSVDEFRLRTRRGGPELKDMTKTLQAERILDGGVVYVESGVPTAPSQIKITFSLYDPTKKLTDCHAEKKKRKMRMDLFEWPFERTITPGKMKPQIVEAVNKLFPLYKGKYTLLDAIKVKQQEIKIQLVRENAIRKIEAEALKATETTADNNNDTSDKDKSKDNENDKETEKENDNEKGKIDFDNLSDEAKAAADAAEAALNIVELPPSKSENGGEPKNIFDINFVRLRKMFGASVKEMLIDNRALTKSILARGEIKLAIERWPYSERFTSNSICFRLRRWRTDIGGVHGKLLPSREVIVDKTQTVKDLKELIIDIFSKTVANKGTKTTNNTKASKDGEKSPSPKEKDVSSPKSKGNSYIPKVENISLAKVPNVTTLKAERMGRLEWPHLQILKVKGIIEADTSVTARFVYPNLRKYVRENKDTFSNVKNIDLILNFVEGSQADLIQVEEKIDENENDNNNDNGEDKDKSKEKSSTELQQSGTDATPEPQSVVSPKSETTTDTNDGKDTNSNTTKDDKDSASNEKEKENEKTNETSENKDKKQDKKEKDGKSDKEASASPLPPVKILDEKYFRVYRDCIVLIQKSHLCSEDDMPLGKADGFHLRNGDCVIWYDVTLEESKEKRQEKLKAAQEKRRKRLEKNPNFKGGDKISSGKGGKKPFVAQGVRIMDHGQWLKEQEEKKKLEQEKKAELEKLKAEKGGGAGDEASKDV